MKSKTLITPAMAGLLAVAAIAPLQAKGVQDTYLGELEYQDQTCPWRIPNSSSHR